MVDYTNGDRIALNLLLTSMVYLRECVTKKLLYNTIECLTNNYCFTYKYFTLIHESQQETRYDIDTINLQTCDVFLIFKIIKTLILDNSLSPLFS